MQQAQKASTPRNLRDTTYYQRPSTSLYSLSLGDIHLNKESLESTQSGDWARSGAVGDAIFSDQTSNIHAQVSERGEEDEAVDGFMKGFQKVECEEDEKDADDTEDGDNAFGSREGIRLGLGDRHGLWVMW